MLLYAADTACWVLQAKKMLGWQPKVELREGLSKMVDDFAKRLGVEKPAI